MKQTPASNFNPNLKIETERLLLRPFNLGDLEAFSLICADPEVMRFIGSGKTLEKEAVKQQMLSWIASYEEQGFGLLALILKENEKLLGFCGLMQQIVDDETYIELGYRLDRAFWGKGIASEAAKSIRDYAFNQLDIPYLISIIQVDNIASKMVAEKIGMKYMKQTHFKGVLVNIFHIKSNLDL
jgi:ribosomal-protein-alanine N-acetyltransferase